MNSSSSSHQTTVALVRCSSYENNEVMRAVRRGIDLLGGVRQFARYNEKILLKPNLLNARRPELNVTTHPAVIRAVAQTLKDAGITVSIGDSPSRGRLDEIYRITGVRDLAAELNLTIADFDHGKTVSFPDGRQNKQFFIAEGVLAADGLINLPKLKTHHLTRLTAAVKNLYGCIPGLNKLEFHVRLPSVEEFSRLLVDLSAYLKPRLTILDAIEAMEGNGPSSGTTRKMNLIALSADPVALDSVVCHLVDLSPEMVRTNYYGEQFGLGVSDLSRIRLIGDAAEEFILPDFDVQRAPLMRFNLAWRYRFLKNFISPRPVIDDDQCRKCGDCVTQCPLQPKALRWSDEGKSQPPVYDYSTCIRCFCCQEVCPHSAIAVETPLVLKLIEFFYRVFTRSWHVR